MKKCGVPITKAMERLIAIFANKSPDRMTLDELNDMLKDRSKWEKAHDLFNRIRKKNLEVGGQLESQYSFEEACAKTLYNLTQPLAPFDSDSPYWILPNALMTADQLRIDSNVIISAIRTN
jgi:hypothetical protein